MMKLFAPMVLLLTAACASSGGSRGSNDGPMALRYEFKHTTCGNKACLKVLMEFSGNDDGSSKLILPSETWGQNHLERAIHSVTAKSADVAIQKLDETSYRVLYPSNSTVAIEYRVIQDFTKPLDSDGNRYRAIVHLDYFHFFGHSVLIYPEMDPLEPLDVRLDWEGLSLDQFANSFGTNDRHQRFQTDLRKLRGGIYVGGRFRLHQIQIKGRPVYLALKGTFGFQDLELLQLLEKVLVAEREFWQDHDFPYFLVNALSISNDGNRYGGSGVPNGFVFFGGRKTKIDAYLVQLLFHELFHTWNGRKIGRMEPEEMVYWFSEGFTDYYARLLSLRSDLIDLRQYVSDYNDKIRKYWTSPVRNESSQRVLNDYWKNTSVERLPYQQGDILAHKWNREIESFTKSSKNLDSLMRDLFKAAQTNGEVVSPDTLERLSKPYLPLGIMDDYEKYIVKGETIPILPPKLGDCILIQTSETYRYDLGFDFERSRQTRIISGVVAGGPADRAGLKNGQILKGWGVSAGDIDHEAEFFVQKEEAEDRIAYVPRGEKVSVPQYALDEKKYKNKPRVCASYFAAPLE